MTECLTTLDGIPFNEAEKKELAGFAKAFGYSPRVRLLKILSGRVCPGSDLVDQLGLAQSTVSEHLRILREANLVDAKVTHPRTCFSLCSDALARIQQLLGDLYSP